MSISYIIYFQMEEKRLSKALAAAGVASRRACEQLIFDKRVQVNGKIVLLPQTPVDLKKDHVTVDGKKIQGEPKKLYYLLNKPEGYICSSTRVGKRPIVLDLFPANATRLFTVGRLDMDTSGLILVTNDGHFAQKVIHPSSNITKEYLVKTQQEITEHHLKTLSRGARIDHRWVKPTQVRKVRRGTFKISLKEGKKHEVRILAERADLTILELKRIRIGKLTLGSLALGSFRSLNEEDKQKLFEAKK